MTDFHGVANVKIDGEQIEVQHIDIETDLSTQEVFGHDSKECDECGGLVHPLDMLIVASTGGGNSGVYHQGCRE